MDAQRRHVERSKLPFMQWPVEWLWIAVIVAVAMLFFLGLFLGTGFSSGERRSVPAPIPVESVGNGAS
jgi:hypothetical protein